MCQSDTEQTEVAKVDLAPPATVTLNPWLAIAGTWREHPELDEVVENIRKYRHEIDADDERL